ncbi:hypothetical protein KR222_008917, partial [Zaprionus bogoriensis]
RSRSLLLPLLLVFLGLTVTPVWSANILALFSTFSPSHLIVHMSMMKTLADRGHNVTVVSALKPKLAPHENITVVLAPTSEKRKREVAEYMEKSTREKTSMLYAMYKMLVETGKTLDSQYDFLEHPNLKAIVEQPSVKYDLMFLGYVMNDFQLGVAHKLGIPVILSWVGVPFTFVDDQVGNTYDPAYVPGINMPKAGMGFGWRMRNFLAWGIFKGIGRGLDYHMNRYYKQAFGSEPNFPSYHEVRRNVSLLFYNYHSHSEGPIRPTVPQSIEIGGIQIKEQPDPLPKDLAEFLDNASEGAIFFSLGTNVKFSFFSSNLPETLFNVLSRQRLRVIWKWDDLENLPGNSSNIYFHNWLPQDDILAHPNTKLFITHAGKGGLAEAQYHGVPMLAMPIFGDQSGNADIMVAAGFGRSLDVHAITDELLQQEIDELLQNPVYTENVRNFSALYRDRPLTARQSVIFWTEYVLRHRGAHHLQSPWVQLDFVARNNLDVHAVLLLSLALSFTILVLLFRFVLKFIRRACTPKPAAHTNGKVKQN